MARVQFKIKKKNKNKTGPFYYSTLILQNNPNLHLSTILPEQGQETTLSRNAGHLGPRQSTLVKDTNLDMENCATRAKQAAWYFAPQYLAGEGYKLGVLSFSRTGQRVFQDVD
jgi:hypothetical protein